MYYYKPYVNHGEDMSGESQRKAKESTVCGLQMCEFCFPKTFTELKVSLGVVPTRTDRVESATRCRPETDVPGTLNFGVPGTCKIRTFAAHIQWNFQLLNFQLYVSPGFLVCPGPFLLHFSIQL